MKPTTHLVARLLLLVLVAAVPRGGVAAPESPVLASIALPQRTSALTVVRPRPRDLALMPERRCTEDGRHCITLASYVVDVCRTIEGVAREASLDPHFFARLVWRESLFDAGAVSPAGAQGIAQFMPGTAELRGLADPFNPASALAASAHYLAELSRAFGNIGLAAVAYNGGEARAERFAARQDGLPEETRHYVRAITGHSAEAWRDAPPSSIKLELAKEAAFQPACVELASARSLKEFPAGEPVLPWGVIVASHIDRDGAERQAARLRNRFAEVLGREALTYTRAKRAGMVRPMVMAQVGRASREEADGFCARLRSVGGDCMVLKN